MKSGRSEPEKVSAEPTPTVDASTTVSEAQDAVAQAKHMVSLFGHRKTDAELATERAAKAKRAAEFFKKMHDHSLGKEDQRLAETKVTVPAPQTEAALAPDMADEEEVSAPGPWAAVD